ncbi:unnamed protein product, partial [Prorocentrum cordatum]
RDRERAREKATQPTPWLLHDVDQQEAWILSPARTRPVSTSTGSWMFGFPFPWNSEAHWIAHWIGDHRARPTTYNVPTYKRQKKHVLPNATERKNAAADLCHLRDALSTRLSKRERERERREEEEEEEEKEEARERARKGRRQRARLPVPCATGTAADRRTGPTAQGRG